MDGWFSGGMDEWRKSARIYVIYIYIYVIYIYVYRMREIFSYPYAVTTVKFQHPYSRNSTTPKCFQSPWSAIFFEQPTVAKPLKKYPTFYGTRKFNILFTRNVHCSLSCARWLHVQPQPICLRDFKKDNRLAISLFTANIYVKCLKMFQNNRWASNWNPQSRNVRFVIVGRV
jgi:hypothetical protein